MTDREKGQVSFNSPTTMGTYGNRSTNDVNFASGRSWPSVQDSWEGESESDEETPDVHPLRMILERSREAFDE